MFDEIEDNYTVVNWIALRAIITTRSRIFSEINAFVAMKLPRETMRENDAFRA